MGPDFSELRRQSKVRLLREHLEKVFFAPQSPALLHNFRS